MGQKIKKINKEEKMRKGLIIMVIVGLGLGFMGINFAHAENPYGGYKDFLDQMSPTMRAFARYGQLGRWVNNSAAGVVLDMVTIDGWTVYSSGIAFEGKTYDDRSGNWYLTTEYYVHGSIIRYTVTTELKKEENGTVTLGAARITAYDNLGKPQFEIKLENERGGFLTVADLERIKLAVTQGDPTATNIPVNFGKVNATLVNLYLTGADIIEMGTEGVRQYTNRFGLQPGAVQILEGSTPAQWGQFANWEAFRTAVMNAQPGTALYVFKQYIQSLGLDDPNTSPDEGWGDNDWQSLFSSIKNGLDTANGGTAFEFDITYKMDGNNPVKANFRLIKLGGQLKLQKKNGANWTNPTDLLIIANYTPGSSGETKLLIGPGRDGKYGTDDDEKINLNQATLEQLRRAQGAALQMMLDASIESGVGPGDSALSLTLTKGTNEVSASLITKDLDSFIAALKSSPWSRDTGGIDFRGWTRDDWQQLYDKVMDLLSHRDDNSRYNTVFTINGIRIKFVRETTARGAGFKIMMQQGADTTPWRPVRHITFNNAPEGPLTPWLKSHIISSYQILTGKDRGTTVNISLDPTTMVNIPNDRWREVFWGDPNAQGYINYDAATGRLTATITRWQDAQGNWHEGSWTVTLDFSQIADPELRERARQQFIDAARNGYLLAFYGIGDRIEDGQIFYILGLGEYND